MNQTTELIVGIDLGTTNSSIAIIENGVPRVLEIDNSPSVPSCVSPGPDGKPLVGRAALNQLILRPEDTILSSKRYMGTDHVLKMGDQSYRAEEIGAIILRFLKDQAEEILKQPIKKAVITVPAFFNDQQRAATKQAAELAGLDCVRLLNEPTAAALAYNARGVSGEKILVYDLGGGTFDVSLVVASEGLIEVAASHGNTQLGGDDIDELLLEQVLKEAEELPGISELAPGQYRRLRKACEMVKIKLSDHPFASISEEYITGDEHLVQEISRELLEELTTPLLEQTWTAVHAAMHDGKIVARDIDKILLVGGSTKMPLVARLMEEKIGITPLSEINPDLIVAMGAAIQAATLAGSEVRTVLVDISAHTFSTAAVGMMYSLNCVPVIRRGTPLPCTRSEVFFTMFENQEKVRVSVYQGESSDPDENIAIGEFMVEGLTPKPENEPIICEFSLDLNGMLKVTAIEKNTGLQKSIQIDTTGIQQDFDLDSARRRMADLFGDEEVIETKKSPSDDLIMTRAKELKTRADRLLESGTLDEEDKTDLQDLLEESREAVKAVDRDKLSDLNSRLEDILFYLD